MPQKHAAAKAFRKSRKANARNRAAVGALHRLKKDALHAAAGKKQQDAERLLRAFSKAADKAVQKGILRKNTGARYKSRLARLLRRRSR